MPWSKVVCCDRCKTFPIDAELSTLRAVAGPLARRMVEIHLCPACAESFRLDWLRAHELAEALAPTPARS